jgi:ornithine cyclodeaminase/alanine dehydrogenase-like protein (mu-crystallin family)
LYQVLTDADVDRLLSIPASISAMEGALLSQSKGTLVAPPRFSIQSDRGGLVFTAGVETGFSQVIGFRVYDSFPHDSPDQPQLVVVYDNQTGSLQGLIIGNRVGVLRTAGINAVAIQSMARPDVKVLGVLGSGKQARAHIQAAAQVRRFERGLVYSPNIQHREDFARQTSEQTGVQVNAIGSAEEVVRQAEVLICATTSARPVFEAGWLKPGMHINTIGPKFKDAHELPLEAARESRVIATDSLEQVDAYPKPFFLANTPERGRMVALADIVAGRQKGRYSPEDITLFCSVGLAGTEVVLANEVLKLI